MTYEAAFQELQQILAELQEGAVSIDQLAQKVERADELVQFCRERLRQTEATIQQLQSSNQSS
ncbi:MAG: exodeoxyribonuclease VII small subunit [Chitinophagales bacterium]|jgi:exodeoxyribonuclease VII small subunit